MDAIIGAPGTGYRETSGEENRPMDVPDPPLGVGSSARPMLEKATDPAAFLHVRHLPRGQPSTAHLRSRTPRGAQRQLWPFKENLSTLTDTCKETGSDQRVRGGYDLTAVSPQPQRGGHRGMSTKRTGSDRIRRAFETGGVPLLGALVIAAVLSWTSLQPAHAAECSANEAGKIAVEGYGGKALSVSPDGDYLIVRLRLSDGRVIDVAVDRWSC